MCAYTIITMTMALVPISRLLALTIFVCKCRVFLRHLALSLYCPLNISPLIRRRRRFIAKYVYNKNKNECE